MEEISVLPGRIRFKSLQLFDKTLAEFVHISIEKLPGVKHSRVNHLTSSILIVYDEEKIAKLAIEKELRGLFNSFKGNPRDILDYEKTYLDAIENKRRAKGRVIFYGSLYLLFRLKNVIFGRFSISRSIRLLVTASAITAIEGYPLINRSYKYITRSRSKVSDSLLRIVAMALIFLREDATGCLLLSLKHINDYLKYSTQVEYMKIIHQSILDPLSYTNALRKGDVLKLIAGESVPANAIIIKGKATIDELFGNGQLLLQAKGIGDKVYEGNKLVEGEIQVRIIEEPHAIRNPYLQNHETKMHKRVNRYQEAIGPISLGLALIKYMTTGDLLNAVSILLLLCPTASELSLNTGINSYLHLMGKHKILVKNPNILERSAHLNHIAFDKTGTLTQRSGETSKETIRKDAYILMMGLKDKGISRLSILTGDREDRAQAVGKELGISSIYSLCDKLTKGRIIQELKKEATIMMVGDGINDLYAMEYADVSVGLIHSSCDKVKLHTDCIIFEDDLNNLLNFIVLSERSYTAINRSIAFSRYYNIMAGMLAVLTTFDPYMAKSLNTLNSLLVMLLNKRIEYFKDSRS